MELSKFEKDMAIIQKLDDEPNDVGGLTSSELKAKFDEGGEALKEYLNETLVPQISGEFDASVPATRTVNGHPLSEDVIITASDVGLGNVDNTSDSEKPISTAQAAEFSNVRKELADGLSKKSDKSNVLQKDNSDPYNPTSSYHPATKKYVDDTTADVTMGKVPDGSITTQKIADASVTPEKLDRTYIDVGIVFATYNGGGN